MACLARHRFTSHGDTVLTVNAERDTCVECALSLGRRIEAFVVDDQTRKDVVARIEASFEAPYREGYFGVSLTVTTDILVGYVNNVLPACVSLRRHLSSFCAIYNFDKRR